MPQLRTVSQAETRRTKKQAAMSEEVTFEDRVRENFPRLCRQLRPEHVFISLSSILPDKEQEILRARLKNEDEKGLLVYDMLTMVRKQDGWQSHVQYTLAECGDPALLQLMCLKDCRPKSGSAEQHKFHENVIFEEEYLHETTHEEEMSSFSSSEADSSLVHQTHALLLGQVSVARDRMAYIQNVLGGEETHEGITNRDTALDAYKNGSYLVGKGKKCAPENVFGCKEDNNNFTKVSTPIKDISVKEAKEANVTVEEASSTVYAVALDERTTDDEINSESSPANIHLTEPKTAYRSMPVSPFEKTSEDIKGPKKFVSKKPRSTHENKINSNLLYLRESGEQGANADLCGLSDDVHYMSIKDRKTIEENVNIRENSAKRVVKSRKAANHRRTFATYANQGLEEHGLSGDSRHHRPPRVPDLSDTGATWRGYTPPARRQDDWALKKENLYFSAFRLSSEDTLVMKRFPSEAD